jgi:uncharacterized protein YaaN involved in tellurite resistance
VNGNTSGPARPGAADDLVADLLRRDLSSAPARDRARQDVEAIGHEARAVAARVTRLLDAPVRDLTRAAGDDADVSRALADLHREIDRLDPSGVDLHPGWGRRVLARFTGAGSPVEEFLGRVARSREGLDRVVATLRRGRDQLHRDTVTLEADQADLRRAAAALGEQVDLALAVDRGLGLALDGAAVDHPDREFLRQDLLFSLRRRTADLQQQLAVTQQGILALDLVLRNNRELTLGVDRALDVTVAALNVAVTATVVPGGGRTAAALARVESVRTALAEIGRVLDEVDRRRDAAAPVRSGRVRDVTGATTDVTVDATTDDLADLPGDSATMTTARRGTGGA